MTYLSNQDLWEVQKENSIIYLDKDLLKVIVKLNNIHIFLSNNVNIYMYFAITISKYFSFSLSILLSLHSH